MTRFCSIVLVILACISGSIARGKSWLPFISPNDTVSQVRTTSGAIPTGARAFDDYCSTKDFGIIKTLIEWFGNYRPIAYEPKHVFHIPCKYSYGGLSGIDCMLVQLDAKFGAIVMGQVSASGDSNKVNVEWVSKDEFRAPVFVYYVKTMEGWMFAGAETILSGNPWTTLGIFPESAIKTGD